MISIITAARSEEEYSGLFDSIVDCFGYNDEDRYRDISWEFLPQVGKSSIFEAYNTGAKEAKGDTLAFIHSDVKIMAHGGMFREPLKVLSKPFTGVVGVAGTRSMPDNGCWWKSHHEDCRGAVYHSNSSTFGVHLNIWPHGTAGRFDSVVVVDGVFMMISKKNLEKLGGFDGDNFDSWHFYDVSLSFKAHLSGLTNYVVPIPLIHKSPGKPDASYEKNREKFVKVFGKNLPIKI